MRVEDFPRPKNDNRRGVHWSASVYHPSGPELDFWISELQTMHIKWVKCLDDGGGSSLELCRRLLAADIMPVVRLYRLEPNPGHIGGREEDTIRRMIAAGVRYFETNNEPDLPVEWQGGRMPANWLEIAIENFIIDADKIIAMGGLPALPAMGVRVKDNPVEMVIRKGRADLFEKGAWIAIHSYTLNHPLDYPYDPVNQEGAPLSQEEYEALGSWAWEGQSREQINSWRASDKNPGATLADDTNCFLSFHLMDQIAYQALGYRVPIISTEGGPVMGWRDDRRYPRITPRIHAEWITAIYDFMQGGREIGGLRCPDNYFAICHWLLGNYRLGFLAPGWESQAWYTDWWNGEFNLNGELPVVAAVKAMPNLPVDLAKASVIRGRLVRADTGEPLADLQVRLLAGERQVATCASAVDGAFRFERLSPGRYDLEVVPWGVVGRGLAPAPEPVQPLIIRLAGGQQSVLAGQVLDHAGTPRAGTPVTLRRDGAAVGATNTAADGSFRFSGLTLGCYGVSVPGIAVDGIALDGWRSKAVKLTAGAPPGLRYAVTTQRLLPESETAGRRIFYGTVSDASGKPVNGIKVQMSWHNAAPGTVFPVKATGHDPYRPAGTYEFVHTPGLFRLEVVQGDYPSDVADNLETARVPGREGQPIAYEVNFRLQAGPTRGRVDGMVPGGRPGTALILVGANARLETKLASDNSFAFTDLAPGDYRIEMAGIGVIAEAIRLEAGGLFRLIFPMQSVLSGRAQGPIEGLMAVLHAPPAWGWTRQTPLDPEGNFSFEGLPPGRYWLEVGAEVLSGLQLTGENTLQLAPIDLRAGPGSVVRGRVADGAGRPQADIQMVLRRAPESGQDGGLVVAQARTAADGTYRFSGLAAGRYSLEAVGMGQVAGPILLDGRNEAVHDVLWNPPFPLGIIQGRVVTAEGHPRPGLQVRLDRDGVEVARTETDEAGRFRFPGLSPGVYSLTVAGGVPPVEGIRLDLNGVETREIVLPASPAKVFSRYLLFGAAPDTGAQAAGAPQGGPAGDGPAEEPPRDADAAERRLALSLAMPYLWRRGLTAGFNPAEAALAAEVTIVGDLVPDATEQALRVAGCQVTRLPGDAYALAAQFVERPVAGAAAAGEAEAAPAEIPAGAAGDAAGKPLARYVLFGRAGEPATLANLLLAEDFLLAFDACFGFSPGEAARAQAVTILADTAAVSQGVEDGLRAAGAVVERISGTAGQVANALAIRIAASRG